MTATLPCTIYGNPLNRKEQRQMRTILTGLCGVALGAILVLAFQGVIKLLNARQDRRARRFLGQRWLDKHAQPPEE
jgi:hypothetical protein